MTRIDEFLDLPRSILKFVQGARALARHVRRHPGSYALLLIVVGAYYGAYRLSVGAARERVRSLFSAVDGRLFEVAWDSFHPQYQAKYRDGLNSFRAGYLSTVKHTDIDVEVAATPVMLYRAIVDDEVQIDVSFTVIDRMSKDLVGQPIQRINALWLQIRHPRGFTQLVEGTSGDEAVSLEMKRSFAQRFVVTKQSGAWLISSISTRSTTLIQH